MKLTEISKVIPEKNIVVFSPHYDDFLFFIGGYVNALKNSELLKSKKFHINLIFSRSNYQAKTGVNNFDKSLNRIKFATGNRLLEDLNCIDELLGQYNYRYEMYGEEECLVRGKEFASSAMEFPHGMFDDFDEKDYAIFERMVKRIKFWALKKDTALIFPLAFKEHIDHFIVREAAIKASNELKNKKQATFYFQEDKPYAGISDNLEIERINTFIQDKKLLPVNYEIDCNLIIGIAFKHYVSQVEEIYKTGILKRAEVLSLELGSSKDVDRIYKMTN